MMQFSPNEVTKDDAEDAHKLLLAAIDMQAAFVEINKLVSSEECETYLSATSKWLEERSIPLTLLMKYIPSTIIEKIKQEAVSENMLRPSTSINNHNDFDFLYS